MTRRRQLVDRARAEQLRRAVTDGGGSTGRLTVLATSALATAVLVLGLAGCSTGTGGAEAEDTADARTTCSLVPADVASQLLGTTRRQATDSEVRSGSGADGDASSTCTLSSEDEGDRFLRLDVRTPSAADVAEQKQALTSSGVADQCTDPQRFDEGGGIGLSCTEDVGGATTTRLTSVWGEQVVVAQVTRPGAADAGDADAVWRLAGEAHATFVDLVD